MICLKSQWWQTLIMTSFECLEAPAFCMLACVFSISWVFCTPCFPWRSQGNSWMELKLRPLYLWNMTKCVECTNCLTFWSKQKTTQIYTAWAVLAWGQNKRSNVIYISFVDFSRRWSNTEVAKMLTYAEPALGCILEHAFMSYNWADKQIHVIDC